MTLRSAFIQLVSDPVSALLYRWNWKAALFSAIFRGGIFFLVNLDAGLQAAAGALTIEFLYRSFTAGFYGALTQAFRKVEPAYQAGVAVGLGMPVLAHSIEAAVHLVHGTPNLATSIAASVLFTFLSTHFNLYAMRHGVLIAGPEAATLSSDLRNIPAVLAGFLTQFRR
jgi:hypothetical protein